MTGWYANAAISRDTFENRFAVANLDHDCGPVGLETVVLPYVFADPFDGGKE
jgi:hypothetical protein